jgi:hypothetical protein
MSAGPWHGASIGALRHGSASAMEEIVMTNGVELSPAAERLTVRDARSLATGRTRAAYESGLRWIVAIPVGCLLTAMLGVAALSRIVPLHPDGAQDAAVERAGAAEPLLPTVEELGGGEALLRLGPAYSR